MKITAWLQRLDELLVSLTPERIETWT